MTCRWSRELILDLARGAAVPFAARRAVEEHMAGCRACAADFDRQKELTAGLQALASEAQHWSAPAAMEKRLLAALAAREMKAGVDVRHGTMWWKPALAAAAVLMLAVWGLTRPQLPQEPVVFRSKPDQKAFRLEAEATSSNSEGVIDRARVTEPAIPRSRDTRSAIPRSRLRPSGSGGQARGGEVAAVEFIRIPSAIGLPEMESGTVMRMELPLTSLPEYGLDIAPDAMRTSVEADVLVGQDGQPRAIRLVGIPEPAAQDSRSRR